MAGVVGGCMAVQPEGGDGWRGGRKEPWRGNRRVQCNGVQRGAEGLQGEESGKGAAAAADVPTLAGRETESACQSRSLKARRRQKERGAKGGGYLTAE